MHVVTPVFKQNERTYRYHQEGYRNQYCLLVEHQLVVSEPARLNIHRMWWPISGITLEPSSGQYCYYIGDKMYPGKKQHDKPGMASFTKMLHRNNARRTYIVWN